MGNVCKPGCVIQLIGGKTFPELSSYLPLGHYAFCVEDQMKGRYFVVLSLLNKSMKVFEKNVLLGVGWLRWVEGVWYSG